MYIIIQYKHKVLIFFQLCFEPFLHRREARANIIIVAGELGFFKNWFFDRKTWCRRTGGKPKNIYRTSI